MDIKQLKLTVGLFVCINCLKTVSVSRGRLGLSSRKRGVIVTSQTTCPASFIRLLPGNSSLGPGCRWPACSGRCLAVDSMWLPDHLCWGWLAPPQAKWWTSGFGIWRAAAPPGFCLHLPCWVHRGCFGRVVVITLGFELPHMTLFCGLRVWALWGNLLWPSL